MSKSSRDQGRRERAAAIQAASARRERNRRLAIVAGVVVALALIVAGGFWYSSGGDPGATTTPSGVPAKVAGHSLVIGPSTAEVKVVVYEDFLCPFCREFELATRDYLHADATKGMVQVEYRPFHLLPDDYSVRALDAFSAVLKSGTPGQALRFHDLLYDKQPYEAAPHKPDAATLASWAADVGAEKTVVEAAVDRADPAYVRATLAAAKEAGVTGTPTVLVNGKQLDGTPSQISDRLEQLIAGQ